MFHRAYIGLATCVLLASCAGPNLNGADPQTLTVVKASSLPAPDTDTSGNFSADRPYLVGPYDRLRIGVFAIPELAAVDIQVDASGRISVPLVGIVQVAGKTPLQIEEIVKASLRGRYLRDPQVTVNLVEAVSQIITISGEVKNPGSFPVMGRMTLLRALALAKGSTDIGNLKYVVIFREVHGTKYAALYNVRAIMDGRYGDPEVYAQDFVIVGESRARQIFKDVMSSAPLWVTPLVVAIQRL